MTTDVVHQGPRPFYTLTWIAVPMHGAWHFGREHHRFLKDCFSAMVNLPAPPDPGLVEHFSIDGVRLSI